MSIKTLSRRPGGFPSVFDDLFDPWGDWFGDSSVQRAITVPKVNISEDDNSYSMAVAAPGLHKGDFKLSIHDQTLTVSAESERKNEEKKENYTRQEFNYSSFSRSFLLPDNVMKDKISASYDGGVLKVVLPKNEKGAAKSQFNIEVQ